MVKEIGVYVNPGIKMNISFPDEVVDIDSLWIVSQSLKGNMCLFVKEYFRIKSTYK